MGLFLFFISAATTFSLAAGAAYNYGECCAAKNVGGIDYTFVHEAMTSGYNCLTNCVYERDDKPGSRFCFARGDLHVECEDAVPTGPMPATTEGPGGDCQCGKTKASRIVGGEDAEVNFYPWMIGLFRAPISDPYNDQWCGASLVAGKFAVTAAHCMVGKDPSDLVVVLGEHDLSSDTESVLPRKVVSIEQIISHENYDDDTLANDIALLELAEVVDLSIYTPACLPSQGDDFSGQTAWIYGWGALSYGTGDYPEVLQEAQLEVKTYAECLSTMGGSFPVSDGGMLCAGAGDYEEIDTCQGDSGGPLTVVVEDQHQLVGATSAGLGCADGTPGIYAEVSFYREWLDQQMADNGGATMCPA